MKKFILLLLLTGLWMSCQNDPSKKINKDNLQKAQQELNDQNKFPVMTFDTEEIDFGNHNEGEILDTVFRFKNTGNATLIISKVRSSCGCTVPEWPKNPIKPGDSGIIKVVFNTNHKTGRQTKTITIHSNEKNLTHILRIKAQIKPKDGAQKPASKLPSKAKRLPPLLPKEKPGKKGERI